MGLTGYHEPERPVETHESLVLRSLIRLEAWARPACGWGVLFLLASISVLPALALRANRWMNLGAQQSALEYSGPLAVAAVWWVWGWRNEARQRRGAGWGLVVVLLGLLVVSQLTLAWIPGPAALFNSIQSGDWWQLLQRPLSVWAGFIARTQLWWQGAQSGGAAQDNLVFVALGAMAIWWASALGAWVARRTRQGIAAAVPSLWLLGLVLLYSSSGKMLLVAGLALAVLLQVLLDQAQLVARWVDARLDYAPGLFFDRILAVVSALALILTVAAIMPNLYWEPLVTRYYGLISPLTARAEVIGDRLFPDARATSRLRSGTAGGLPNDFLLQGGIAPGTTVVMRVRTDEAPVVTFPFDEMGPPLGHYVRGSTFTVYSGLGWSNPRETTRVELDANVRYEGTTVGPESFTSGETAWGRRLLVQSVIMELGAQVLFAAAEPVEFSVPARLELLPAAASSTDVRPAVDDLVTAYGRERSYTVVSSIPAVDERTLRSLPPVAGSASGELSFGRYLALPDSITARTVALSTEIVAEAETPYDRALAIESYLRQFEYDLTVPEPPSQVTDVADFFLFELQRGYCDYYATAFVVLARLAGLPTRFATGYAMGGWDPMEGVWVVTEGEAHSWPEVFFSDVGWVAFEPTAGRPTLARIGLPGLAAGASLPPPLPGTDDVELVDEGETNSQVWFWLIPGAFILWGLVRLIRVLLDRREDPWQSVLRWGEKAGLPMGQGETVIEYGERLAAQVTAELTGRSAYQSGEATRVIAREVRRISREVSRWTYSPPDRRDDAKQAIFAQWQRTSGYLRTLQLRRPTSPD